VILILIERYGISHIFMMITFVMNAVYDSRIPGKGLAAKVTWREVRNITFGFVAIGILIVIVYAFQDYLLKHVEYMKGLITGVVLSLTAYVIVKKCRGNRIENNAEMTTIQ